MKLSKEDEAVYRGHLVAGRDEVFGIALQALVTSELERVKETILVPGGAEVALLQGEARAYKQILKFLKERPVSPKQV